MIPGEPIGRKYDRIARWWHETHKDSQYGIPQIARAISYCRNKGRALDIGCGSGGRIFRLLGDLGFTITGVDASAEMIALAGMEHPELHLVHADIREWSIDEAFDLIIAWDSIFHLEEYEHEEVITKLVDFLAADGVLIYSLGDAVGSHESDWHGDKFPYGSIGIDANLRLLMDLGCHIRHVELDQYPQQHAYVIAQAGEGLERVG